MPRRFALPCLAAIAVLLLVHGPTLAQQDSTSIEPTLAPTEAYPLASSQQPVSSYGAIETYAATCSSCSEGGGSSCASRSCNRCGCTPQYFHWIKGPGHCDQWCVGPHWNVEVDGLMLFRDDADWGRVNADLGLTPNFTSQFDHGAGARVFATAYNDCGFGMQIGYEGVSEFNARNEFAQVGSTRAFDYNSSLHSIELNFLPRTSSTWKLFGGFRYVELDENLADFTTNDIAIPAPTDPAAAPFATIDNGQSRLLENTLLGVQIGGLRDSWSVNSWFTIEPFANAGVYCNKFKRDDVTRTVTTITTGDDLSTADNEFSQTSDEVQTRVRREHTEIAFIGEAGISGLIRINRCVSLRGGYQVLVLDGVGNALDASFAANFNSTSQLYHGAQFGIEYRR